MTLSDKIRIQLDYGVSQAQCARNLGASKQLVHQAAKRGPRLGAPRRKRRQVWAAETAAQKALCADLLFAVQAGPEACGIVTHPWLDLWSTKGILELLARLGARCTAERAKLLMRDIGWEWGWGSMYGGSYLCRAWFPREYVVEPCNRDSWIDGDQ